MTQEDKELIANFCRNNLHTHTDWTGTRVETIDKCESVEEFINKFLDCIKSYKQYMNKICTDIEQSKKLIELGIDVNTADMLWTYDFVVNDINGLNVISDNFKPEENDIPAWSLSALLELIPPYLGEFNDGIDFGFSRSMNGKWYSAHYIQLDNSGLATFNKTVTGDTSVDVAFEMICWLKAEKYI